MTRCSTGGREAGTGKRKNRGNRGESGEPASRAVGQRPPAPRPGQRRGQGREGESAAGAEKDARGAVGEGDIEGGQQGPEAAREALRGREAVYDDVADTVTRYYGLLDQAGLTDARLTAGDEPVERLMRGAVLTAAIANLTEVCAEGEALEELRTLFAGGV